MNKSKIPVFPSPDKHAGGELEQIKTLSKAEFLLFCSAWFSLRKSKRRFAGNEWLKEKNESAKEKILSPIHFVR